MAASAAALLTMVVRLYANSPADLALIADARAVATDLLGRAGVDTTWIVCARGVPCDRPVEGDVIVRLLPDPPDGSRHCGSAAGTGLVPSGVVTLYTRCIESGSERLRVPRPIVVGYSLVHELGHLVLRRRGHAMSGMMAAEPNWRYAAAGGLQFTPNEVAAIHAALAASAPERERRLATAAALAEEKAHENAPTVVR